MKSTINARAPGPSADDSFDEFDANPPTNVRSLRSGRTEQTVEDVVKAYFDSMVMQTMPEELDALVRRLG